MDIDGYRWAPKTFVFSRAGLLPAYQKRPDRGTGRFERQTAMAKADERGLHVQFPGLRIMGSLKGCSRAEGNRVLLRDASSTVWYTFRVMDKTVAKPYVDSDLDDIQNLAIVLPRDITAEKTFYYGILVSICEEGAGGVLFSRLVARASLDQWGVNDVVGIRILTGIQEPNPASAVSLGEGQQWCIG
jgi:hypothetical protein